jgi:class 3 adenylate cyclase
MPIEILSHSTRRKLASIFVAISIFACLGAMTTAAVGRPVDIGTANAVLIGLGVGLFEELYVHRPRGNWLRAMHPVRSLAIYAAIIIVLYLIAVHITHLLFNRLDDLPTVYRRLPYGMTFFLIFSVVGVLMMRVIHFIGLDTLFHLILGTYHRPVRQNMVLLFLDINDSTALGEKLGPLRTRDLVRKFLDDVTQAIVDNSGDIYLYKGDGLIATWTWDNAVRNDAILRAVDLMFSVVAQEGHAYQASFGVTPRFRVGIHGGEVVVSEQGNGKRSIGIYGDTINIAARMEEAARAHGVRCVISSAVAKALVDSKSLRPLGEEQVKGISAPVFICAYEIGPAIGS